MYDDRDNPLFAQEFGFHQSWSAQLLSQVENDIDAESDGWRRWSVERLESEAAGIGEQPRKRVPIMQGIRRWDFWEVERSEQK